jgi:lysophospholipase L1-like esterase
MALLRRLLIFLTVLLGLELTTRAEEWIRFDVPIASRYRSQSELLVRDADGMHGRSNAVFLKWRMNSLGLRGPEVTERKAPGMLRVVATGASETFGLYESPGGEYPRQIEDSLRAVMSCGRPAAVEVLNAAFAGMTIPTIVQDLGNRVRRLEPDVVLLYPTPPMYLDADPPVPARPDSSVPRGGAEPSVWRALYPRSAERIRNEVKAMVPEPVLRQARAQLIAQANEAHDSVWRFRTIPRDRLTRLDQDVRAWVGTVRGLGAAPVLITHANAFAGGWRDRGRMVQWERFHPRATGETLIAFDSVARDVLLEIARDSSVAVADGWAALRADGAQAFADYTHFTDRGAAKLAGLVAGVVKQTVLPATLDGGCEAAPPDRR